MYQEVPYTERKFLDREATPNPSFFAQWFEITDPNERIREYQYYRTRGVPLDEDFFETDEQLDNYLFNGNKPLAEPEDYDSENKFCLSLSLDLSSSDVECSDSEFEDDSSESGSAGPSFEESKSFDSWNDDEEEVDFSALPLPTLDDLEEDTSEEPVVVDTQSDYYNSNTQHTIYPTGQGQEYQQSLATSFGNTAPMMYMLGNCMVQPGYNNVGFYNQPVDTVPPQSHSLFQDVLEHEEYSDSSEKMNHAPSANIQSERLENQFNQMSLYNNAQMYHNNTHASLVSNPSIAQNGNVGNSAPLMMGYYYPVYVQPVAIVPLGNSPCYSQLQVSKGSTISSGKVLPCLQTPGLAMAQWAA